MDLDENFAEALLREAECHREMRTGDHTPIYIEVMSKPREKGAWRFDDRLLRMSVK